MMQTKSEDHSGNKVRVILSWRDVVLFLHTGIAQLVEHRSPKPGVGGSNPSARATFIAPFRGVFI